MTTTIKKQPMVSIATGFVGLVAAGVAVGLLAWPSTAADDGSGVAVKRDEDTPDIVLVDEDDENDQDDDLRARVAGATHTALTANTGVTRTQASRNTRSDRTRTGARSGRDDSRSVRAKRDWTDDGRGRNNLDRSVDHTNDRTRNNTRR